MSKKPIIFKFRQQQAPSPNHSNDRSFQNSKPKAQKLIQKRYYFNLVEKPFRNIQSSFIRTLPQESTMLTSSSIVKFAENNKPKKMGLTIQNRVKQFKEVESMYGSGSDEQHLIDDTAKVTTVKKMVLSRIIICYIYNVASRFRTWKRAAFPHGIVTESNTWFQRSANLLAKSSHINLQKSFWRLYLSKPIPKKVKVQQITRTADCFVVPSADLERNKKVLAILHLQKQIGKHLKCIIHGFWKHRNSQFKKQEYCKKVIQNYRKQLEKVIFEFKLLAKVETQNQRKLKKIHIIYRIIKFKETNIRRTFKCFLRQTKNAHIKKVIVLRLLLQKYKQKLKEYFVKIHSQAMRNKSKHRQKKLIKILKLMNASTKQNLSVLFVDGAVNNQKVQKCLNNLERIAKFFYRSKLKYYMAIWKSKRNQWFKKAASRLAVHTKINSQKSLWRLYNNTKFYQQNLQNSCYSFGDHVFFMD